MEASLYILSAFGVLLFTVYLIKKTWLNSLKHPPGPPILPVIGSLPFLNIDHDNPSMLISLVQSLRKKHGNIVRFALGSRPFVAISGYKAIREALVDNSVVFAGRPHMHRALMFIAGNPYGIIDDTYSEEWKNQRSITMVILRELGYGKRSMEVRIAEEAVRLTKTLTDLSQKPTDPEMFVKRSVSCVICQLTFGKIYSYDSAEFKQLLEWVEDVFYYFYQELEAEFIPILRLKPRYHAVIKKISELGKFAKKFTEAKIDEHRATLLNENIRDFTDGYLVARQYGKLEKDRLVGICLDFILAGTETTTTTMLWAFVFLLRNPDVLRKVHTEIDSIVGRERLPTWADREKMPYTQAVLAEVQRMGATAPMALPHSTLDDCTLQGYHIQKDTEVWINLLSVLYDPEIFPDPDSFKPERFIDADGNFFRPTELVVFSMGRRSCLGENLARQELFLFLTILLQTLTLKLPDGQDPPSLETKQNVTLAPRHKLNISFVPRI